MYLKLFRGFDVLLYPDSILFIIGKMLQVAAKVIADNIKGKGARIVINDGEKAGQEVLHLHIQYVVAFLSPHHSLMTRIHVHSYLCVVVTVLSEDANLDGLLVRNRDTLEYHFLITDRHYYHWSAMRASSVISCLFIHFRF